MRAMKLALVLPAVLLIGGLAFYALAASSTDWPEYGRDPGGMRFSPLTQITPANVSQLKLAWTYHMRPTNFAATAANAPAPAGRGAAGIEVETPDGAPGARRGGGRFGSGFRPSQDTPLVIDGTMYIASPYSRVVALEPATGKEIWTYQLPSG